MEKEILNKLINDIQFSNNRNLDLLRLIAMMEIRITKLENWQEEAEEYIDREFKELNSKINRNN